MGPSHRLPLPLLLLLLGSFLPRPASSAGSPLNVCVIGDPAGWDYCDPSRPSSTFTGFDIELWRDAAARAGWAEEGISSNATLAAAANTFRFVCSGQAAGWGAVAAQLAAPGTLEGQCGAASGFFSLSLTRMRMGLQFSLAYYRTGLAVLIKTGKEEINLWAFWRPFSPELWIAFFLTLLSVPPLVWLVEQLQTHRMVQLNWDSAVEAWQATYSSLLAMFNLSVYKVRTLPAQLNIIFFCFLILIVMATYVANLAADLTTTVFQVPYTDINQLKGRAVAAHSSYVDKLSQSYGLQAAPLDWDGHDTFDTVKEQLLSGELDAYIMDYPELGFYMTTSNDDCTVRLMPDLYTDMHFGFLFHRDLPAADVAAFNAGLFAAMENNLGETLAQRFLVFPGAQDMCTGGPSNQIRFIHMAGLWVMLASSLGFSLVWTLVLVGLRLSDKSLPKMERTVSSMFVVGDGSSSRQTPADKSAQRGGGSSNRASTATITMSETPHKLGRSGSVVSFRLPERDPARDNDDEEAPDGRPPGGELDAAASAAGGQERGQERGGAAADSRGGTAAASSSSTPPRDRREGPPPHRDGGKAAAAEFTALGPGPARVLTRVSAPELCTPR